MQGITFKAFLKTALDGVVLKNILFAVSDNSNCIAFVFDSKIILLRANNDRHRECTVEIDESLGTATALVLIYQDIFCVGFSSGSVICFNSTGIYSTHNT